MDELPPKAAALLRAARHDHNPSRADSERVRTALAAALLAPGVNDVPGEATNAGQSALGASKGASGLLSASWIKGVAVLSVVGSASLWAYLDAAPPSPRAPSAQSAAGAPREDGPSFARARTRALRREALVPARELRAAEQPATPASAEQNTARTDEGAAPATPPSSDGAQAEDTTQTRPAHARRQGVRAAVEGRGSAREQNKESARRGHASEAVAEGELSLIRRAIAQLNAGAPASALELLSQHAARYPNGVMSEERDGLRAIALCKKGDLVQGKASALSFLRLYPGSAMAGRVRGACKESAP